MPALRSGPPYIMADAMAREPELVERIAAQSVASGRASEIAGLLHDAAGRDPAWPPSIIGCGSSEHAGMAVAAMLREAWREAGLPGPGPVERQSLEAAEDAWPGLTIAISHEGASWATLRAMSVARARGSTVVLITGAANAPAAAIADSVLCTGEVDPSWCHTIGYLAPVAAGAAIAGELAGRSVAPPEMRRIVASGRASEESAMTIARGMAGSQDVVIVASGSDRAAARELALKLEEAAYVPTAVRDLETLLHGHLAAVDVGTGVVLLLTDRQGRSIRVARARQALVALQRVGARTAGVFAEAVSGSLSTELTPLGRIVVPEAPTLPSAVAASLGTAVPLQMVAYHLALEYGTNPDAIRREMMPYRLAAEHVAAAPIEESLDAASDG
jgi:glucosamine--fructose-6-phosphate aminotransferase (isomerizing)